MLATEGKESPGLQVINHKPNCFHTRKETKSEEKKLIHKWANHREVKLPHWCAVSASSDACLASQGPNYS